MGFDRQDNLPKNAEIQLEEAEVSASIEIENRADRPLGAPNKRDPFRTGAAMKNSPRTIGYIRVSTPDQKTDRQTLGLKDSCDQLFIEHASAVAKSRPMFEEVQNLLRAGDTLVVWDLDRAFRSTVDAIQTAEDLRNRKVDLRIISMQIDTSTPEGELFYTMLAGFAQYERRMISRRTREGVEAARRSGKPIGRPRKIDVETSREAHLSITKDGYPCRYVAALLGVSRITLQRSFRHFGLVAVSG